MWSLCCVFFMSRLCHDLSNVVSMWDLCRDPSNVFSISSLCCNPPNVFPMWSLCLEPSNVFFKWILCHDTSNVFFLWSFCHFYPMSYLYGFPKTKQHMISQFFQACYTFLFFLFCSTASRLRQFSSIKSVDNFHVNHQTVCVNCNIFFSKGRIISIALFQDSLLLSVPYFTLSIFTLIWGKCLDIGRARKFVTTTTARKISMLLGE